MDARRRRDGSRLTARPGTSRATPAAAGEVLLRAGGGRALLYVPARALAAPAPLAVMLHGAGGRGEHMRFAYPFADEHGLVVLAPDAGASTWDVIVDEFGPDVTWIDHALADTFSRIRIDPRRVAAGGFSDGASYALSLGTINGDLFTHVLAFSPGFMTGRPGTTRPRIFISHGARDEVLPIARTSRTIAPRLEAAGYDVTYREFDGGHAVPDAIARDAFEWLME